MHLNDQLKNEIVNFENMKSNIFPFELPPNPAVSDLYQLSRGGSGVAANQLPSFGAVGKFVDKVEGIAQEAIDKADPSILLDKVPKPDAALAFIKPSKGELDLNISGSNIDTEFADDEGDDNFEMY